MSTAWITIDDLARLLRNAEIYTILPLSRPYLCKQASRALAALDRLAPGLLDNVTEIAESGAFTPDGDATTTWLSRETAAGPEETTLEALLDLPTHAPVEGNHATIAGGYDLWKAAQQGGKRAAREYALHSGENTGDTAQIAMKRQAVRRRVQELLKAS